MARPVSSPATGSWPAGHELAEALLRHAAENPVVEIVETAFGVRYVVEGILHAPDGRTPEVRAVWFMDLGADAPKLVTAYPIKRR